MGIYVFNRQVLIDVLENNHDDFGKHIIPASLQAYKVFAYIFQGYWEDIGTVRAFYEANLALTDTVPNYNFFDHLNPIYTYPRFLPASKINGAQVRSAIIADGCIITDANIERAIIGIRSVIESGSSIRNSVLMGADFYQGEHPHSVFDSSPAGHRTTLRYRRRHYRQKCPYRGRGRHNGRRQTWQCRWRKLLHPRRGCGHPKRCCHSSRNFDLIRTRRFRLLYRLQLAS